MTSRRYVYRLVIGSWPTENGLPFAEQTPEFWADIVDRWANPHEGQECPDWVPDLCDWLPGDQTGWGGGMVWPERAGVPIWGDSESVPLMCVPKAPTRRYFQKAALHERLNQLREWGCVGHIERAQVGEWEVAS